MAANGAAAERWQINPKERRRGWGHTQTQAQHAVRKLAIIAVHACINVYIWTCPSVCCLLLMWCNFFTLAESGKVMESEWTRCEVNSKCKKTKVELLLHAAIPCYEGLQTSLWRFHTVSSTLHDCQAQVTFRLLIYKVKMLSWSVADLRVRWFLSSACKPNRPSFLSDQLALAHRFSTWHEQHINNVF